MTEPDDSEKKVNPGYALAQLVKALSSTGETAQNKIEQWSQVIRGMIDGSLKIGSRTPVENFPIWVTPEVAHGGFATGSLAASGPLRPHELEILSRLRANGALPADSDTSNPMESRNIINLHFVSEEGRKELEALMETGGFRVHSPEEGALLVVAWLLSKGETEHASPLLETISPFFDRLRFYPQKHSRPLRLSRDVFVCSAGESSKLLRKREPNLSVQKMNEAIKIWTPLYDRAVSLFLETIEGEQPHMKTSGDGELERGANGQPQVEGGFPCRHYPSDWSARAKKLLSDYDEARSNHTLCKKPEKPKENFARLRKYLAIASSDPTQMTEGDIRVVRKILASFVTKHGAPDSERRQETRAEQTAMADKPMHYLLARTLAHRLEQLPDDEGIRDPSSVLGPLSESELQKAGTTGEVEIPAYLGQKVMRSLEAPLETLIEKQVVSSGEVMAKLLPSLTASIRVESIDDESLARVFADVYKAFRRRRSLLLLNLEQQAKFEELPWIKAVSDWTGKQAATKSAAHAAMKEAVRLHGKAFPHTIFPNTLVQELQALKTLADIPVSLVNELAADIFMGTFTPKFLTAAQESARLLESSIYERYYGIDYSAIRALKPDSSFAGVTIVSGFSDLCKHRAYGSQGQPSGWSVASNGKVIEQSQILTTHNLAGLLGALDLTEEMKAEFPQLARRCFSYICHRLQLSIPGRISELQSIKNCAYAWRQMLIYLSLSEQIEMERFLNWSEEIMQDQPESFRNRFAPALIGLKVVAQGETFDKHGTHPSGGRRFLGWTTERHWLATVEE